MDETVLERYRKRHNQFALLKAAGWLALSIPAWIVSWVLIWVLFAVWAYALGSLWNWRPSWHMCGTVAWAGTALLALDGIRFHKRLFRLEAYRNSLYNRVPSMDDELSIEGPQPRESSDAGYLFTQLVFIAPRSVVNSIHSLLSLVRMDDATMQSAQAIVTELSRDDRWTEASHFHSHADALRPLEKLGVLHHRLYSYRRFAESLRPDPSEAMLPDSDIRFEDGGPGAEVRQGAVIVRLDSDFVEELAKMKRDA